MSSGGGQTPAQTTATSTPWSGAQPALQALYNSTQGQYQSDVGYQPYPGNLQAPLDSVLGTALSQQYGMALPELGGTAGVNAARTLGQNMLNQQGLTSAQLQNVGQMQSAESLFGDIYSRGGNVYNQAINQQNPYLLSQLAAQDRRIADKVNSAMSGAGRYGSGAHTDVLARSLAEASYPVLAQDYAQRQQQALGALGAQQGAMAGAQGTLRDINQVYGTGMEQAGKWAQLIPALDEARYAGVAKMQDLGKFYQDRAQQDLANQVAVWNAQQARPWEQLARYANIVSGAGGLGGTKVTTANPYQPSTLARIGGGALAGAGLGSAFPGIGTGIGALGGGLLGLLG